jgi:hypothetical protein
MTPTQKTEGVSPKVIAAGLAALFAPVIAKALGVDAEIVLALLSAVAVAIAGYLAPPGTTSTPLDPDLDDPTLESDVAVPTLTKPPSASAAAHSNLEG